MHKVITHINMLRTFMKHLVFIQENVTLTITKQARQSVLTHSLPNNPFNQIASFTSLVITIYSASIVDKAIEHCRVAFQEMSQPPMVNGEYIACE